MPSLTLLRERGSREWLIRVSLAAVVVAAALLSISHSLARHLEDDNPEAAYRLAPYDGEIAAFLSLKLMTPNVTSNARARAQRLARRAILESPLAVSALVTMGLNAQIGGDSDRSRQLFAYSEVLSRRDLVAQLWLAQDAVARNDVNGALNHYDIALRTWPDVRDILFPILASSISYENIRSGLLKTLSEKPQWGADFVNFVPGHNEDRGAVADFLERLDRMRYEVPGRAKAALIANFAAAHDYQGAWSYYVASFGSNPDRGVARDPHFMIARVEPSLFDWTPINEGGVASSIQPNEHGGIFSFNASPGSGGPLVRQMEMFQPGDYVLRGHSSQIDQPDDSLPYWSLTCVNGQEIGRVDVPRSAQAGGMFDGRFSVPENCPAQWLVLSARISDSVMPVSGQIDYVALQAAR